MTVDPQRRNRGVDHVLLSRAEQWVHERGGQRIRMTVVNVPDTLIARDLQRGYVRTGETSRFLTGRPDTRPAPIVDGFDVTCQTENE